jgi:hypothetical protein
MVKFSREYEASIIPEWKAAFVDYKGLKKLVKRIKIARRDRDARSTSNDHDDATTTSYGFSVLDPVRALASHFNNATPPASPVRRSSPLASLSLARPRSALVCATYCSLLCRSYSCTYVRTSPPPQTDRWSSVSDASGRFCAQEGGSDDALRTLESDSGELVRATDKHVCSARP